MGLEAFSTRSARRLFGRELVLLAANCGGFSDDLTGRESAILAGVVAGLTRREVEERLDEMVAFAEVGSGAR